MGQAILPNIILAMSSEQSLWHGHPLGKASLPAPASKIPSHQGKDTSLQSLTILTTLKMEKKPRLSKVAASLISARHNPIHSGCAFE